MYYQCLKCEKSFDAESAPNACPFCQTEGRIAIIKIPSLNPATHYVILSAMDVTLGAYA